MSENKEVPYIIVEKDGSHIGAFLWGALVGAAAALLLAPKSGAETQEELKEGARRLRSQAEGKLADLRQNVEEGYDKLRTDVTERMEQAREDVAERKRHAEEALRAGKEAARRAREDLEKRVTETKAAYRAQVEKGENGSAEAT
ncbi:MAG: YtxH domain-containing protein [Gemmatimonadota bacterium]